MDFCHILAQIKSGSEDSREYIPPSGQILKQYTFMQIEKKLG